ncbi:MAG: hypothetical protein KDA61_23010, partial [Planctomycetales bacterium]|nr:hypothetical protein [Planctomycetales bacterium]
MRTTFSRLADRLLGSSATARRGRQFSAMQRRRRLAAALSVTTALVLCGPAQAINLTWDDEGGSADKTWTNNGNWSPDNLPDDTDDLFIGVNSLGLNVAAAANDATVLNGNINVNSVTLGNGADIINSHNGGADSYELQVDSSVVVESTGNLSDIRLYAAPAGRESLDANTITVGDNGQITLISGSLAGQEAIVEADAGMFDIQAGGRVFGMGRIELNDNPASPTTLLNNNGTLTAGYSGGIVFLPQPASRLHITATNGNARVDLDGSGGNGQVDVFSNATLDIDVAVNDGVDGTMNLSAGSTLDVQDAWSFGGAMNVNTPGVFIGFGGAAATIDGGTVTQYGGTIMLDTPNVDALRFAAPFIANGGAIVNHGRITFDADATINAGSDFQMNGEYASIIVGAGATVRIDDVNYNLDGDGTATNVATVGEGGRLDLNLGAGADVVMDNVINLNGGQLDVSTAGSSWTISRELNLANTGSNAPAVNGDAVSVGNDSSAILAVVKVGGTGISNLNAPVTFMSDTQVDIAAGATLRTSTATFESVNGVSNASFTGAGTWRMAGTNTFNEATTINMTGGTVDLDSSGDLLSLAANDTFVNAPLTLNVGT